jgi:hypothetical protein
MSSLTVEVLSDQSHFRQQADDKATIDKLIELENKMAQHDESTSSDSMTLNDVDKNEARELSLSIRYDNHIQVSTAVMRSLDYAPGHTKSPKVKRTGLLVRCNSPLEDVTQQDTTICEQVGSPTTTVFRSESLSTSSLLFPCGAIKDDIFSITFSPSGDTNEFLASEKIDGMTWVFPTQEYAPISEECNIRRIYFKPSYDSVDDFSINCDSPSPYDLEISPDSIVKTSLSTAHKQKNAHFAFSRIRYVSLLLALTLVVTACTYLNGHCGELLAQCSVSASLVDFIYSIIDVEIRKSLQRRYYRRSMHNRQIRPAYFLDPSQNHVGVWVSKASR